MVLLKERISHNVKVPPGFRPSQSGQIHFIEPMNSRVSEATMIEQQTITAYSTMRHPQESLTHMESQFEVWPIKFDELSALVDLGLSDALIAAYFKVEKPRVSALRSYFGLSTTQGY
jgi:hypothetical protein